MTLWRWLQSFRTLVRRSSGASSLDARSPGYCRKGTGFERCVAPEERRSVIVGLGYFCKLGISMILKGWTPGRIGRNMGTFPNVAVKSQRSVIFYPISSSRELVTHRWSEALVQSSKLHRLVQLRQQRLVVSLIVKMIFKRALFQLRLRGHIFTG